MSNNSDKYIEFDFDSIEPWKESLLSFMGQLLGARLKKKISQAELAKRMDVKQSVISRFEHAGRMPTFEFLYKVTEALDMQLLITPFGDRTIVLSPEQKNIVMRHISVDNPDIFSVISTLIDNCSFDPDLYITEAESTDDNYIYDYKPEEEKYSLAACALN